ncbi:MAG: nuclear transport factor 2 family protein [Kordiimonadaceae bacterium]|nr:nuclear transport factor 2 family protein [Kordiimonadaceae bacterium]MBO6569313.1 nuclear transport factor 2 family protein [Kordiimonadaceae bacterium]MBO6964789.1 nuclear transport factor 2 family protein [Kordiimonadaceae bacterium]
MTDLVRKTEKYVRLFDAKDLDGVASMMSETITLSDPAVHGLSSKSAVVEYVKNLFDDANGTFSFQANRVLLSGHYTVLEFTLVIGSEKLQGVDVIEWKSGQIDGITAYLHPSLI